MPWFYFHLRTPSGLERDDVGVEFAGIEAAYLEACHTVPALWAELVRRNANPHRHAFEISDAAGRLLMEVPFREILDRGRRPAAPMSAAQRRKAAAEIQRTRDLIDDIHAERAALRTTLAEMGRLLALARQGRSSPF